MKNPRRIAMGGVALASVAALALGGSVVASADPGSDKERGEGGKGGALTSLVEAGTISSTEAEAIREAMRSSRTADREAMQAEHASAKVTVLDTLVADGTLSQAQADAIAGAERGGMRELISQGVVDREDMQAVKSAMQSATAGDREAMKAERTKEKAAVLDGLVADGTLTQTQADAVASAMNEAQAKMGEGKQGKHGQNGQNGKFGKQGNGEGNGEGRRGMGGPRA